jgi:hypothetical protein
VINVRRILAALVLFAAITGCSSARPFAPTPPVPVTTLAAALITVPNVVGENAAVADDKLKKLGFTNITFGTVDGRMVVILPQNWTVKTQSAQPDERLAADTKIVLGCVRNG